MSPAVLAAAVFAEGLLSMLGRMTPQKGWRALRDAIPAMVDEGALVLAVGSGNAEYEIQLKELEQSCPGRAGPGGLVPCRPG